MSARRMVGVTIACIIIGMFFIQDSEENVIRVVRSRCVIGALASRERNVGLKL